MREALPEATIEDTGVGPVRGIRTGEENVHVTVVGVDGDDRSRIGRELDDLGLEDVDGNLDRCEYHHAYHGFALDEPSLEP